MRLVALDLKILNRQLGAMPWLALVLWCSIASLQEPLFFRIQGLDLLWPAASAGADVLCLVACGLWSLEATRHYCGRAYPWWSGAVALVSTCLAAQLLAIACCMVLDAAHASPTPWASILPLIGRGLLVWLPVGVVAACLAQSAWSVGRRLATLTLAFLVILPMNPVSMFEPMFTFDKLVAAMFAVAGTSLLAIPLRQPQHEKNPR